MRLPIGDFMRAFIQETKIYWESSWGKTAKTLQSCQLVDSRDALARKFSGAAHCSAT